MTAGPGGVPEERVASFIRARFGAAASVERLAGDASDRAFYRLRAPSLSPLIAMVYPEPFELDRLSYFLHARFLHDIGAAVPQIVASYPREGVILLQDLGDETLQTHLGRCDASRRRFLYLQAVQIIAFLQNEGTAALTPELPASSTALDADRLLFELRFFCQHYIDGMLSSPLTGREMSLLEEWFVSLVERVTACRQVLCHRDFHARNLMVKGDRLYMVDFQDARMGPYTYDLASLLRDSYVDVPPELARELVEFFRETARLTESAAQLLTSLDETALQRNIKAIGTFASQAMLRGNRSYLRYIPPTLERVVDALGREGTREVLALFEGPLGFRSGDGP
jgi:hypothetical protein